MESSGIGGGAEGVSEATQEAAPVEQAPARDYGQDIDRLSQTMEQFGGQFTEFLQSQQQPEEPEAEEPDFDPSQYYEDEGQTLTAEGLQQMIDARAQSIAQEQLKPLQEQWTQAQHQQNEQRIANAADALQEQYPELEDEGVQERLVDAAKQQAMTVAQSLGQPQLAEQLWREPEWIENTYLAMKARERAENEVPAGSESGLTLERGNSLGPSGTGRTNQDIADSIVKARG